MRNLFVALVFALVSAGVVSADVADVGRENKVLPGRMSYFYSPRVDMQWVSAQVKSLESVAAADKALSPVVVIPLLERVDQLALFTGQIRDRVRRTLYLHRHLKHLSSVPSRTITRDAAMEIVRRKKHCYPFSLKDQETDWRYLYFYHCGFFEGRVNSKAGIIETIKSQGFYEYHDTLFNAMIRYDSEDIPDLLQAIEDTKDHIASFGVPSAQSLLYRLRDVRVKFFKKL